MISALLRVGPTGVELVILEIEGTGDTSGVLFRVLVLRFEDL